MSENIINNRYRIENIIKSQDQVNIYRAFDLELNMPCTVKEFLIKPQEDKTELLSERVNIFSRFSNKNLFKIRDFFLSNRAYYIVTDYVEGEPLITLLKKFGSPGFPEEEVIEIGIKICSILKYLHTIFDMPVIYRELNLENIIIGKLDKRLNLTDFGFSAILFTAPYSKGEMKFIAPEVFEGDEDVKSDIYSLGVVLYTLLAGKFPSDEGISKVCPGISRHVDYVVTRCLEKDREKRFASVNDVDNILSGKVLVKDETIEILSLIEKLKSPVKAIKEGAKTELTDTKRDKAIEILVKILTEDKDEDRRLIAIESLLLIIDDRGINAIIKALRSDVSSKVREKAAGALGIIKNPAAIEHLIEATKDKENRVVLKAILSLSEFKDERTLKIFKELIENTEDPEMKRQLRLAFTRSFPDVKITIEKSSDEKKKEMEGKVSGLVSFATNWKIIAIVILLILVPVFIKLVKDTGGISFSKQKLTKEGYTAQIDSMIKEKNKYVKDFYASLENVYVKQSGINEASNIELWNYSKEFSLLKKKLDDVIPPDDYKKINEKVKEAMDIYKETAEYSGNVYTTVKVSQTLSYDEVLQNIKTRIKEGDRIMNEARKEIKTIK